MENNYAVFVLGTLAVLGVLCVIGYYYFRYTSGDFEVANSEEVAKRTYEVHRVNVATNRETPAGHETHVTTKVTYKSGRVKYITHKYKC